MDIERINEYSDSRFSQDVLFQHGAFIVDGKYPCSFKINGENSAAVEFHDYGSVFPVIDTFRFYTEHITSFYDNKGNLIAEFPPVELKELPLEEIRPSQFYVDEDKLRAVSCFIRSENDIIIPVMTDERTGKYISLDGHTRMYYAYLRGWKTVKVFNGSVNECIFGFAEEARKRGVIKISDIKRLSHSEYEIKWNKFCEDYFANRE
ncbi:MAG: hypothetical protein NC203_10610 [Firmicutes bacterium]|nr:hypothetical protein [Bacillota bacterium]